jgi:tetratricopeptide (TPR) repeat protein
VEPGDLHYRLSWRGRPIADRRLVSGELLGDGRASKGREGWRLDAPDGPVPMADGGEIHRGEVEVRTYAVRRHWLPRWIAQQGDLVLPTFALASALLALQLQWLAAAMAPPGGGGVPEPSPEYLARLLAGDFAGREEGVVATPREPKPGGEKIESFYLQPGHAGPLAHIGGGKNVGKKKQEGDQVAKATSAPEAPPALDAAGTPAPPESAAEDPVADADPEPATAEPVAMDTEEGWGLTDWYDTEDARQDREEVQRMIRRAQQVLRLDPEDPYALNILGYYQYLATDFAAARESYEHMLRINPEDPAAWNNLALTYKRTGDYKKEEELYHVSLGFEDDPNTWNNLAICYAHQGRYAEALQIMADLEVRIPDDPYADLHRAKIYAAKGEREASYRLLRRSLQGMRKLDTLHNIEYQQDIRVDPVFESMRKEERFRKLLLRFYGDQPTGWWRLPGLK